ncbi:MAG: methyltransferase [Nanoarchaeota archaeon]
MYNHFLEVKKKYDDFYRKMMKDGLLPMRSTAKGFWGASISHEVYAAFEKLKLEKSRQFLDLGSGDGSVVMIASLFGPKSAGVEFDEWLIEVSRKMQRQLSHLPKVPAATFHHGDYFEHSLQGYDTIFINPDVPFFRGVESKLLKEMTGRLIVYGHDFLPQHLEEEQHFVINGTRIGVYRAPK